MDDLVGSSSSSLSHCSDQSSYQNKTFKYKIGETREKVKPKKRLTDRQLLNTPSDMNKKREQMKTKKFAGTTMFKKQQTKKVPFYEPVVLTAMYPKLKSLKTYDCMLEE